MAPPRSVIWKYFQTFMQDDSKLGKCKECEKTVKCGVSGTQGLKLHLKNYHVDTYEEFRRLREANQIFNGHEDDEKENAEESASKSIERMSDKVTLSGGEFQNDTVNAFKEMIEDENFTNVTLVTEGNKSIKAHKVILSAFSPFFKEIILKNNHPHPLVYLYGIKHEYVREIVNFVYLGQAKINLENVNDFINVANHLKIKGLCSTEDSIDDQEQLNADKKVELDPKGLCEVNREEDTIEKKATTLEETQIESVVKEEFKENTNKNTNILPLVNMNNVESTGEVDVISPSIENANIPCEFPDCKYIAAQKRYLREHRQAVHEGIKYPCEMCDHKGSTKSNLKKHILVKHTNEKYPCHQCEYLALSTHDLGNHNSEVHSGFINDQGPTC